MSEHESEIRSVTKTWAESFNSHDAAALAALYAKDAVLWGTLSAELTSTPNGVRQYFERASILRRGLQLAHGVNRRI